MNTAHEGMDDMGAYLDAHPCIKRRESHRAQPLPMEWPTRRAFIPQGCTQQGRHTPTIEPKPPVDRVREDYDKPEPLPPRELVRFWAVAMAPGITLIGVVGFAIWVRFGHVA